MCACVLFFFIKHKTAYEMRISDWSSDVCSSDLGAAWIRCSASSRTEHRSRSRSCRAGRPFLAASGLWRVGFGDELVRIESRHNRAPARDRIFRNRHAAARRRAPAWRNGRADRSEEHTSELQSLMRISYAVFCLKKKKT